MTGSPGRTLNLFFVAAMFGEAFLAGVWFAHLPERECCESLSTPATEPDLVSLLLDTGHHAYRGGNAVEFMRRHHSRIPYLHLKSVDPQIRQQVTTEKIPFAKAVAMGVFCEPSRGAVDFKAFRDVLDQVNYRGWAIVEQDMYPAPFDKPMPIAKRTRAYLKEIGIG